MLDLIINMSRFIFIILGLYFTYLCVRLYQLESYKESKDRHQEDKKEQSKKMNKKQSVAKRAFYKGYFYKNQKITILTTHFLGFMILVGASTDNKLDLLILYVQEILFFMIVWFLLKKLYYRQHYLMWNISLYLMSISFILLTRIDYNIGYRQFIMAVIGYIFAILVPIFINRFSFLDKMGMGLLYIGASITLLVLVTFIGTEKYGATNWILISGLSFQPSEIIKILFIFFLASIMTHADHLYGVIFTGICSLVLIILLVYQKDLGTALIFFVIYVTLIYISTNKSLYFFGGLTAGSIGAFVAYKFYAHVQYRVEAWLNPWADVDKRGYQIAQSLFAIGAGGWFGYGLTKGMPKVIPAVPTDFIFAAICEEFGNIFSILLIVVMTLFFLEGIRIAKEAEEGFYLLVASGISCIFAFQTFLIIGGVTKFIPITGVTLPFMSSGGTSLVMSIIMLGILEGIHMYNQEGESNGKKKAKRAESK